MRKMENHILLLVLSLFMLAILMGCSSNKLKDIFGIEQFQSEMQAKNYKFEVKDAEKDFLPTTRKRMIIGDETLDIYLFDDNIDMENEAKYIDGDGSVYSSGSKSMKVRWISSPHFYKRGNIIVQYIGTNEKIISDLKDILGEQFAGRK
jgi:hypothetical protein